MNFQMFFFLKVELPDKKKFALEDYGDSAIFIFTNFGIHHANSLPSTSASNDQHSQPEHSNTPYNRPTRALSRKALTVVRVVKTDIGSNGKPANVHAHNMTVDIY